MDDRRFSIEFRATVAQIPLHTTQENLSCDVFYTTPSVVFPYHSFVICAWYSYTHECGNYYSFAIYQADALKDVKTFHDNGVLQCDDPVSLVYLRHHDFSDMGDAVADAIARTQCIYADILMNN